MWNSAPHELKCEACLDTPIHHSDFRNMQPIRLFVAAGLLAFGVTAIPSNAADTPAPKNGKGPAYTEPPKKDPNYQLIGEFIGPIAKEKEAGSEPSEDEAGGGDAGAGEAGAQEASTEMLGLQIRSIGGDEFEAMSFMGGLPGQDQHKPTPIRMIGRRSGDFVVLSGGPWAIFVEKDSCLLLDRKGNKVGQLQRIHRTSPTLGARPPKDSIVLFDGTNIDHFTNAQMTKDGLLMEGADLKPMFQDFNMHVEFRLPYMPEADGQQRANSGLYLQSRYECQVLDSFATDPVFNGCGALYRFRKPDFNMCLPPLVWQSYDVQFTAPRWAADGTKLRDAHLTSWVNGVKVHDNVALPDKTGAGKQEEPVLLPIRIQDHGDPVRFRNIWIVDRGLAMGEFPVYPTKEELEADAKAEREKKQQAKAKRAAAAAKKKAAAAKRKAEEAKQPEQADPPAQGAKPEPDMKQEKKSDAKPAAENNDASTPKDEPATKPKDDLKLDQPENEKPDQPAPNGEQASAEAEKAGASSPETAKTEKAESDE